MFVPAADGYGPSWIVFEPDSSPLLLPKNLKTHSGHAFQGITMNRIVCFACVFLTTALLSVNIVLTLWKPAPPSPPFYQEITAIKNRLTVKITEPNFTNPVPKCEFYEVRQQESDEYFQTTINYQVFQHGKETRGDIEAFVEIYNVPEKTNLFIVEVARNCWNELTVYLDGSVKAVFPTVTEDNMLSLGYTTFPVAT